MSEISRAELRDLRERAVDTLTDSFAADLLDMDEFEQRIDRAHRAKTRAEIDELVADLGPSKAAMVPTKTDAALETSGHHALTIASDKATDSRTLVAVLGGVERKGSWRLPARLRTVAILGGAQLDLREAVFAPGVHEIDIFALMGGVELIVPPNVAIECDGAGILGGFESVNRAPTEPDPDRPLLRVRGVAMLGGVEISTRLPGESKRDARRRHKRQLRAARKRLRSGSDG